LYRDENAVGKAGAEASERDGASSRNFSAEKYPSSATVLPKAYPYFHTDASQAAQYLSLLVPSLGVDLMTLDGSKIYGPKGIGALYVRGNTEITPLIYGGGQEKGMRSGTENVPAIVGFAEALNICQNLREKETLRLTKLRDYVIEKILAEFPNAHLNGDRTARLPNNINICFEGLDAEFAVIKLDAKGIACASVSSCKNLTENSSSYVIKALGEDREKRLACAESSLRFSMGRTTTKKDLDFLFQNLKKVL